MKRTKTLSIRELIDDFIDQTHIEDKLYETRIRTAWSEIMSPFVRFTASLYIKDKVLFVSLTSSVVRNELMMRKSEICKALNEKVGKEVIVDIVFR